MRPDGGALAGLSDSGILDQVHDGLSIVALAGHPPALLFGAAGVARFLAGCRGGAPLEQLCARQRRECPLRQLPDDASALAIEVLRE